MKKNNFILMVLLLWAYTSYSQINQNSYYAGQASSSTGPGYNNVGIGEGCLISANINAAYNTAVGANAMNALTSGNINCAFGDGALLLFTTGTGNTMLGEAAGSSMTSGSYNVAIGYSTMGGTGNVSYSTAVGFSALGLTTSNSNSALGYQALANNTSGLNDAFGYNALYTNTTGSYNVGIGNSTLQANSTAYSNTAIGYHCAYSTTTGSHNDAHGDSALFSNTTGIDNVAMGAFSLVKSTGSYNTALGNEAGALRTGYADCTFLGASADASGNYTNSTALGCNAYVGSSYTVQLGSTAVTSIVGCGVTIASTSDARVKKDIKENVPGLSFIKELRPVTYHYDMHKMDQMVYGEKAAEYEKQMAAGIEAKGKIQYTGFIAQEVEASAKKLGYDFSGFKTPQNDQDMYGLAYSDFVVPLVKGMQEQQNMIEAQQNVISTLTSKIEVITAQLNDIKECCNNNSSNSNGNTPLLSSPQLFNAVPNPTSGSTVIYYFVPATYKTASIELSDMNGQVIQTNTITNSGYSSINLQIGNLANAIYSYSLIVDGKLINTKNLNVILK